MCVFFFFLSPALCCVRWLRVVRRGVSRWQLLWGLASCFYRVGSPVVVWLREMYHLESENEGMGKENIKKKKKTWGHNKLGHAMKMNSEAKIIYMELTEKPWQSVMHTICSFFSPRLPFLSDPFPFASIIFSPTKKSLLLAPFYRHRNSFNMSAYRHSIISLFMYSTFYSESHVNEERHYQP